MRQEHPIQLVALKWIVQIEQTCVPAKSPRRGHDANGHAVPKVPTESRRNVHPLHAGRVKFVGFDTSPPLIEGLRKGEIDALVARLREPERAARGLRFLQQMRAFGEHLNVLYVSSETFMNAFIEAVQRKGVRVSVVSTRSPWRWVSISGRVVDIQPDEGLAWIDRMAHKYTGRPYERRGPREIFTIEIDRVTSSGGPRE